MTGVMTPESTGDDVIPEELPLGSKGVEVFAGTSEFVGCP